MTVLVRAILGSDFVMSKSNDDPLGRAGSWKVPPPDKTPATPEPPPSSEPGEFTRMFQTPAAPADPVLPGETADVAPTAPAEPGDFTRMFSTPAIPREAAPQPPVEPRAQGPGEFTRMFQSVEQPIPQNAATLANPVWQPAPPAPAPPPPSAPMQPTEAATGIFKPTVVPPEPTIQQPSGVSEFTRVIAVPTPPPPPAPEAPPAIAASAPAPQPTPVAKPSYLPLILILNALFIIAILVVLYFALKK